MQVRPHGKRVIVLIFYLDKHIKLSSRSRLPTADRADLLPTRYLRSQTRGIRGTRHTAVEREQARLYFRKRKIVMRTGELPPKRDLLIVMTVTTLLPYLSPDLYRSESRRRLSFLEFHSAGMRSTTSSIVWTL